MMAGATPIRTSEKAKFACVGESATSAAATRPMPPARTCPFSATMLALGSSQSWVSTSTSVTGAAATEPGVLRSAPEQKTVPVAVRTTQRTAAS